MIVTLFRAMSHHHCIFPGPINTRHEDRFRIATPNQPKFHLDDTPDIKPGRVFCKLFSYIRNLLSQCSGDVCKDVSYLKSCFETETHKASIQSCLNECGIQSVSEQHARVAALFLLRQFQSDPFLHWLMTAALNDHGMDQEEVKKFISFFARKTKVSLDRDIPEWKPALEFLFMTMIPRLSRFNYLALGHIIVMSLILRLFDNHSNLNRRSDLGEYITVFCKMVYQQSSVCDQKMVYFDCPVLEHSKLDWINVTFSCVLLI